MRRSGQSPALTIPNGVGRSDPTVGSPKPGDWNLRLCARLDRARSCRLLGLCSADGAAVLANAGHVPPYLNGKPISIDGALPLGVFEHAEFSTATFTLASSDRLVIASDGLAEATSPEGELFGFTRVQELVESSKTAAEVADAVQVFVQEDDISIIALTRVAPALA